MVAGDLFVVAASVGGLSEAKAPRLDGCKVMRFSDRWTRDRKRIGEG